MNLDTAQRVLGKAVSKAQAMNWPVAIAVVDTRGDLVALARLDGAKYFTPDMAQGKAIVSATFGAPSAALADASDSPAFQVINRLAANRMVFAQGGMPLTEDGQLIGGIGVGGASAAEDEEVAQAGAAPL